MQSQPQEIAEFRNKTVTCPAEADKGMIASFWESKINYMPSCSASLVQVAANDEAKDSATSGSVGGARSMRFNQLQPNEYFFDELKKY